MHNRLKILLGSEHDDVPAVYDGQVGLYKIVVEGMEEKKLLIMIWFVGGQKILLNGKSNITILIDELGIWDEVKKYKFTSEIICPKCNTKYEGNVIYCSKDGTALKIKKRVIYRSEDESTIISNIRWAYWFNTKNII